MKLPLLSQMREAAQHLLNKGTSAAIQQAMEKMRPPLAKAGMGAAPGAPPQAPMRDINPPPAARQNAQAQPAARQGAAQPPAQEAQEAPASQRTTQAQAQPPQASPDAWAQGLSTPNPATHPTEFAQDMLNRMGIQIDLQANFDRAMDVGTLTHPSPATPMPDGAKFLGASYTNHAGSRNYKLYVPSSYQGQAMPLLVMLHGCTQNPDDFAAGTQMNQVAEEMQCLVVYPEQNKNANNSKCWNWFNAIDQQRDQGEPSIIAGITRQVMDDYAVNGRQVYVAGLSAGGAMAVIVGTLYPELYAAVGVHSGLPFASAQDLPSALSAMKRGAATPRKAGDGSQPIIVFHGDNDTTVNPRNGEQVMEQRLHDKGGKDARPSVQSGAVPGGHRYTQTTHRNPDGTPLGEHWVVHGAGHAWFGGSHHGSYTDAKGPDASREMVRFFRDVS